MTHLRFILGLASLCVLAISTCFAVEAQSEVPQRVTQAMTKPVSHHAARAHLSRGQPGQ